MEHAGGRGGGVDGDEGHVAGSQREADIDVHHHLGLEAKGEPGGRGRSGAELSGAVSASVARFQCAAAPLSGQSARTAPRRTAACRRPASPQQPGGGEALADDAQQLAVYAVPGAGGSQPIPHLARQGRGGRVRRMALNGPALASLAAAPAPGGLRAAAGQPWPLTASWEAAPTAKGRGLRMVFLAHAGWARGWLCRANSVSGWGIGGWGTIRTFSLVTKARMTRSRRGARR